MSVIKVPSEVLEGIMVVKDTGALNMFDYVGVMKLAESLGYPQTAEWMRNNKKAYSEGIFVGFDIEEESGWDN